MIYIMHLVQRELSTMFKNENNSTRKLYRKYDGNRKEILRTTWIWRKPYYQCMVFVVNVC